jgi:hypothetical protein
MSNWTWMFTIIDRFQTDITIYNLLALINIFTAIQLSLFKVLIALEAWYQSHLRLFYALNSVFILYDFVPVFAYKITVFIQLFLFILHFFILMVFSIGILIILLIQSFIIVAFF